MRAKRWVTTALIGVIATLGLGACGGGEKTPALGRTGDLVAKDVDGVPLFEPTEVQVRLNQETRFTFQNQDDKREHNFTLTFVFVDADNFVSVDVPSKQTKDVRFTVKERPRDGFLTFYCRFHQAEGMQGRIKIS